MRALRARISQAQARRAGEIFHIFTNNNFRDKNQLLFALRGNVHRICSSGLQASEDFNTFRDRSDDDDERQQQQQEPLSK